MSKAPFVVRWRDAVMDDPALSWRAKASAMPLVRHADVKTGHNCYPGAKRAAEEMSLGLNTVKRGWKELVDAGYLEVLPLAVWRRKSQGAVKVFKFPVRPSQGLTEEPRKALVERDLGPVGVPTFPGKPEDPSDPSNSHPSITKSRHCSKHPDEEMYRNDGGPWECIECNREAYWAGAR
jgi:hypothetical protein